MTKIVHHTRPTSRNSLTRRQVMIGAAGLSFAFAVGKKAAAAVLDSTSSGKAVGPWVSIADNGWITIRSAATEMGQGSMTSLPLILAEELDADWSQVRIVPAPPIEKLYGNPGFGGMMYTAGSNAVRSYFQPLRIFGAQVRRVLLDNAARHWGVPVDELATEPSVVIHAKSGRRLSYAAIAAFAEVPANAPEIKPEQLKRPNQYRLIGRDVMRVELPHKVNGSLKYGSDVQVPDMLYGTVLRAPVDGAAPDKIDDARAKAIPGVIKIVKLPYGVGVVAETMWAALDARTALSVTWSRTGKAWGFDSDKGMQALAAAARDVGVSGTDWFKAGEARAELPKAATTMHAEYLCDYAYHAQMEPLNAVARVSTDGKSAEIWCGTQSQTMAHAGAAQALGLPRGQVTLHDMQMGGGFGRRGPRDADFIVDAALLAKEIAGRAVKVQWTREDDVRNGRFRPLSAHYLRAGLDASGKLTAWHHRLAGDRVTEAFDPVRYKIGGQKDFILMLGADLAGYAVPHQLVEQLYQDTGVRTAPLRGISFTANKYATEAFIDEIAAKRGINPLALRLELLAKNPRGRRVIERVAQMAEWSRKRDGGRALGVAFLDYAGSQVAGIVEVSVDRGSGQITVHNIWCTIDCGIAVQPDNVAAQSESSLVYGLGLALTESISIRGGAVEQSNFYDYRIPRMNEVPPMHVEVIATDNAPTGAGQMATPLVAPAIANAIASLTGVRLRHTPFTPERVKKALG